MKEGDVNAVSRVFDWLQEVGHINASTSLPTNSSSNTSTSQKRSRPFPSLPPATNALHKTHDHRNWTDEEVTLLVTLVSQCDLSSGAWRVLGRELGFRTAEELIALLRDALDPAQLKQVTHCSDNVEKQQNMDEDTSTGNQEDDKNSFSAGDKEEGMATSFSFHDDGVSLLTLVQTCGLHKRKRQRRVRDTETGAWIDEKMLEGRTIVHSSDQESSEPKLSRQEMEQVRLMVLNSRYFSAEEMEKSILHLPEGKHYFYIYYLYIHLLIL